MVTLQLATPSNLTEAQILFSTDQETQKWVPHLLTPILNPEENLSDTTKTSIVLSQNETLIGWVNLIQKGYTASLEYTIFHQYRGQGLGKEMILMLHHWVKQNTNIQCLLAVAHQHNTASNRTLYKANYLLKESRKKFNIYSHIYPQRFISQ